jgi:hypothetical protein
VMFLYSVCNKLDVMLVTVTYFERTHLQTVCVFLSGAHLATLVKFFHLHI